MTLSAVLLNRLALVAVSAAVGLSCWAGWQRLTHAPELAIRSIAIEGDVDAAMQVSLREALGRGVRGTFFTIDLSQVRHIVETTPWVEHATVRRIWPQGLMIGLLRFRMVGVWSDGRLVSDRGELFTANVADGDSSRAKVGTLIDDEGMSTDRYMEFAGDEKRIAEMVERSHGFEEIVGKMGARLARVELSERGAWTLTLIGKDFPETLVELGREAAGRSADSKLAMVASGYGEAKRILEGAPARIDARYKRGFAATKAAASDKSPREDSASSPDKVAKNEE